MTVDSLDYSHEAIQRWHHVTQEQEIAMKDEKVEPF